jgi:dinuclear metal center YbgI/SA1388 family protein
MELHEVVNFLDKYLEINRFRDSSSNGLQISGGRDVERIAFAVDACMETFQRAKDLNSDMVVVHHGLIWGGLKYIKGVLYNRLKYLMESGISLYVAHLPLDAHPEIGNNVQILKLLGAEVESFFAEVDGREIGACGRIKPKKTDELVNEIEIKFNTTARFLNFGKDEIERISVVSGGGSFAIEEASKISDCLVTGEVKHEAYHTTKELGFNVIFAGHYATETVGLKALMEIVEKEFSLDTVFIDVPTGT